MAAVEVAGRADAIRIGGPPERVDAPRAGWRAALALSFTRSRDRTVIAERRHVGPMCIQRPFYPEDGVCHAYVLHPPGGLAGGDRLELRAIAHPGAAALMTTPASTKFYRSLGAPSTQEQTLTVANDASLEWLPLDSILFGGSRAHVKTRIELASDARFIGWEMTSLGRPLSGDGYDSGSLRQRTEIRVDGEFQLLERTQWEAGDAILRRPWGLDGFGMFAALYAYPANDDVLGSVRERLGIGPELRSAATRLNRLLVVRALAARPEALRELFEAIWAGMRPAIIGCAASAPRIWRT